MEGVLSRIDNRYKILKFSGTRNDFATLMTNNPGILIFKFTADWCGPCKSVAPQIAELARIYYKQGDHVIVKENVDNGFSQEVRGVPAFHFYKNGKKIHEITGADLNEIKSALEQLIKSN